MLVDQLQGEGVSRAPDLRSLGSARKLFRRLAHEKANTRRRRRPLRLRPQPRFPPTATFPPTPTTTSHDHAHDHGCRSERNFFRALSWWSVYDFVRAKDVPRRTKMPAAN